MCTLMLRSIDLTVFTNRMLFITCKELFRLGLRRIVSKHCVNCPAIDILQCKIGNLPLNYKHLCNTDEDVHTFIDYILEKMRSIYITMNLQRMRELCI